MEKTYPLETDIASLAIYMDFVESAQREIRESNSDDLLLFRGQSVDEPLLPKMARIHMLNRDWAFLQRHKLIEIESRMLHEFKRRSRPLISSMPELDLDWLALAQHHGMNTRLLDWTSNALVGLFFALEESRYEAKRVVWLFRMSPKDIIIPSSSVNPFTLPVTKFYQPSLLSPRIIAQEGWFSVHKYMKSNDSFVSVEHNKIYKSNIKKLRITGKRDILLMQLNLCGINRASLFPGLDGLCAYLNWEKYIYNNVHIRPPQEIKKKNI